MQQADLATITAGTLQIGYRNPNGTVSFTGNIDVAGNIQLDTDNVPELLLVTGGAVTESGGGIGFTGATPLQLGVLAGSATMNQDNAVGTLAAFTDGATPSFSFVNDNQSLTIDALNFAQAGIFINHNGFPVAVDLAGASPNPLSGITTANGGVAVTVAGSGTLTLNQPINAGTGSVTAASVGDLTIAATGSVTGGAITLATLGNFINDAGAGALTAGSQWLVYSTNPTADTDDGLTPAFIQYAATYPVGTAGTPTAPDASGNGFLYSIAPQVTVDSVTKAYDGTAALPTSAAAYTFNGGTGFNGDSITALVTSNVTGTFATPNAGAGIDVTLSGLTVNATNGGIPVYGYGVVAANGGAIGTITPLSLTAAIVNNPSKVYDGTTAATLANSNFSLSGFVAGQGASVTQTGTYATANVGSGLAVSTSLTAANFAANSGTLLSNYILPTAATGTGTITPATLTATIVNNPSKVYDGATVALLTGSNFSLSGFVSGEGASVTQTAGTYATANAGMGIGVSASLAAANFAANSGTLLSNYVLPTIAAGTGTISPATLTAAIVNNPSKFYDGTTAATLASANFSLSGFVAGQGASVTQMAGTYATANAGNGITVTASLAAANFAASTGTLLSNYVLPTVAAGTGTITPATLTAGLTGSVGKVYDGTTAATLNAINYELSGVIGGDTVSLIEPTMGNYASKDVGSGIAVGVSGLGLSGISAGNYVLASTSASANIGIITPATLTAQLIGTVSKIADGTTVATLTPANYRLLGVLDGDAVNLNDPSTGIYATALAGSGINVSVSGLALVGASRGDYVLASTSADATIGIILNGIILKPALLPLIIGQPQPVSEYEMPFTQPFFYQPSQPLIISSDNSP